MLEEKHPTPWHIEMRGLEVYVHDANGEHIFGYSSDEGSLSPEDREDFLDEMVARVNAGSK